MRSKGEIEAIFTQFNNYFKRMDDPSFQPEYEASTKVLQIIQEGELIKADLYEIVQTFNQTTKKEHYSGSGWLDFKYRIQHLLQERGFETYDDGDKIGIRE